MNKLAPGMRRPNVAQIQSLMDQCGLSKTGLIAMGIGQSTVDSLLNGEPKRRSTLARVAQKLNDLLKKLPNAPQITADMLFEPEDLPPQRALQSLSHEVLQSEPHPSPDGEATQSPISKFIIETFGNNPDIPGLLTRIWETLTPGARVVITITTNACVQYHGEADAQGIKDLIEALFARRLQPNGIYELEIDITNNPLLLFYIGHTIPNHGLTYADAQSPNSPPPWRVYSPLGAFEINSDGRYLLISSTLSPDDIRSAEDFIRKSDSRSAATEASPDETPTQSEPPIGPQTAAILERNRKIPWEDGIGDND